MSDLKRLKKPLIISLIIASIVLTVYDWTNIKDVHSYLWSAGVVGIGIVIAEVLFIAGVVFMAISAGESFPSIKKIHKWPGHFSALRGDTRSFAENLLTSRLFAIGFWMNFVGAVGTSTILVFAILKFAPYTGIGVLAVIIVDLVATFGWRIPLEIARQREVRRHGVH